MSTVPIQLASRAVRAATSTENAPGPVASMRAPIQRAVVRDTEARLAVLDSIAGDVTRAARVEELVTEVADVLDVDATIVPAEA